MDPKRPFVDVGRYMVFAAAACMFAPACAAVDGEVALSSQLVDRGVAIARAGPALQGAVSWAWPSGWSLGVSGGIELRDPDHLAESLVQLSRYWPVSTDWRMQARLLYYHYSGVARAGHYEAGLAWIYRDALTFGLSGIYSPDRDRRLRPAVDVDFRWPLRGNFSIAAGAGMASYIHEPYNQYEHENASYYHYGHLELSWASGPWQLRLERLLMSNGDRERMHGLAPSPWAATLSRSF
jgi:uncharacterized protein (TIGR02001 family)